MKPIPVILLFILSYQQAYSQNKYAVADSIAASVKEYNIDNLHKELTGTLVSDESQVRSFYTWIAQNIQYDVSEWQRPEKAPQKQEPGEVLRTKKAICHGYAELFRELCQRSGIPCYLVSGYNRLENKFDDAGHTWNMVFINNKWQPVDVTWGAGGVDPRGKYIKEFEEKYFLSDPVDFLQDHYPFDPMWQLVFYPVKLNDYKSHRWTYVEKTTPYFNFNDTITAWEQLDRLERDYVAAMRMLRFSPGDPLIRQQLAHSLFTKGNAEFEKGNRIMAVLYPPKTTKKPVSASKTFKASQLDSIDNFYRHAEFYYKQVQFINNNERTVLKNNMEALKYNREVVRKEKSNISK